MGLESCRCETAEGYNVVRLKILVIAAKPVYIRGVTL